MAFGDPTGEIVFPREAQTSYPAKLRFTLVDKDEQVTASANGGTQQVSLYLPQGIQFSDKMEYENANLGALGAAIAGGQDEGLPSESLVSKEVQDRFIGALAAKFGDQARTIAAARNRQAPNPNTRALFKQVTPRNFAFSFKLIPTSEIEANDIKNIIKFFRTEMYPETFSTDVGGVQLDLGYKFPNRMIVEMIYGNTVVGPKIAPAYIDSFMTNFNPTTQAFFKGQGSEVYFSEVDINLTMMESKALTRKDILEGF